MAEKIYSGQELEKALLNDDLSQTGVELVGMVKASEKEGHVSFTASGCDGWVDLPTSMIEQAENVGQSSCKEHSHALFKIRLRESKNPEAQILAALLARPQPQGDQSSRQLGPGGPPRGLPAQAYSWGPRGGRFGDYGVKGVGPNVGFWPDTCSGRGCWRCAGWRDCINMINTVGCPGGIHCYEGWATGDVVCDCY
jgi:hypothetical protein